MDPVVLDFGDDHLSTEDLPLALTCLDCEALGYTISVVLDPNHPLDPNWLSVSPASGELDEYQALTVTATRALWPVGDYVATLIIDIVGHESFEVPVTMTKPKTDPPITAWLEVSNLDPNDREYPIAGLLKWQRITDTVCISTANSDWYSYWHQELLAQTGRDMHIIGGLKTNAANCPLDDSNHWGADLNDPNFAGTVAGRVGAIATATGEKLVVLDNECLLRKCQDLGQQYCQYECDPDDFDPNTFASAMEALGAALYALDPNLTVLWYPGVTWGSSCDDPNDPPWVMEWTESLMAEVCPSVAARVASLTFDGEDVVNDGCAIAVRDWEIGQCGLAALFPIIYIGDPNDPNNYDPNDPNDVCGYGCSWTWLQTAEVLSTLRGAGVADAIFYPGHTNWAVTGQAVAETLWDPNQ